jgi:hypothetical protein
MFFANEDHLRITKVRTADGLSPIIGEDEKPMKKIITAPLNPQTKKLFEEQNSRLPTSLKMKIDVVKGYKPEPVQQVAQPDNSELLKKLEELQAQNAKLTLELKEKETTATVAVKEPEVTASANGQAKNETYKNIVK